MGKLAGDGKQKAFFRIVTTAFFVCCAFLLQLSKDKVKISQEPAATNTKSESVVTTALPEEAAVSEEPDSMGAMSHGVVDVKVKGIYVTGPVAGLKEKRNELIHLVESTKLNAMVIDIKNDSGEITYKMDYDKAKSIGAVKNYIPDIESFLADLKEKNIYRIARIVVFKDPILAEQIASYSIKNKDGTTFRDNQGLAWVNPYNREVWKYVLHIAVRAADLGFDEIQFDYIRFPTASGMENVTYGPEENLLSKQDVITQFTQCASDLLKKRGVKVSADVFGGIISSELDSSIVGQNYTEMSGCLDCISPMIYPSQFANGSYGVTNPDSSPYEIVYRTLVDSKEKLGNDDVAVRPWLQDFTATWLENHVAYDEEKIRAQIEAVYASGYEEWILWNASNRYTEEGIH